MSETKRILIAEDEEADVVLMQIALKELSLENDWAAVHDGQEALDYLFRRGKHQHRPQGNPQLVLLDMKLPKVSGLEVLRQLRSDSQFQEIQVVIFSSSLDDKDKSQSLSSGASDFMIKPMDFESFRQAISKAVNSYLDLS